jgi:hypothetical protein
MAPVSQFTRQRFNLSRAAGAAMKHDHARGHIAILTNVLLHLDHPTTVIVTARDCQSAG